MHFKKDPGKPRARADRPGARGAAAWRALSARIRKLFTRRAPTEELDGWADAAPRRRFRPLHALSALTRWLLVGTLMALCVGVFYVAVILGEVPELQEVTGAPHAVLASPAPLAGGVALESADIAQLAASFPAPLAVLPAEHGFVLQSGRAEDVRVPGYAGLCRTVTLVYQHAALSGELLLTSATPSGYLQRFAQQAYALDAVPVQLGALSATGMTLGDRRILLADQQGVVYVLEGRRDMAEFDAVPGWVSLWGAADVPVQADDGA